MQRGLNQRGAIVVRHNLVAVRQHTRGVELAYLGLHAAQRLERVAVLAHQGDALAHFVAIVHPDDAQPGRVTDRDVGHVAHGDRRRLADRQQRVADVFERFDEAEATHVEGLLANVEIVAARADIGVGECGGQGGKRNVVVVQFLRIDVNVVLLGKSAEGAVADHARHGAELTRDDPVVNRLLVEKIVLGTLDGVAVDLADGIFRRDARRDAGRKADELELVNRLGVVPVVVAVPRKVAADVRQAEQRDRAHRFQVARGAERVLQRHGDQAFHFLRAEPVGQRQQLDHRLHRVGIGFDVDLGEGIDSGKEQRDGQADDHGAALERDLHQRTDHRWLLPLAVGLTP